MNRVLSLLIPAIIFAGYIYQLNTPIKTSGGTLPALGRFFNPFTGFWQNAESKEYQQEETLEIDGLMAPVTLVYDERLVPHIFAANEEDAVLVQGYLHAKYRLWQMDITTRQASGRLSEVFGENLVNNDKRMRKMGLARTATAYAESWKNCTEYPLLEKYSQGINHYIDQLEPSEFPFEFKLFGYSPERWTVEKTAQVVLSMNLMLCGRNEDLMASNTLSLIGDQDFKKLFPRWNPKQSPIIPEEISWNFSGGDSGKDQKSIGFFPGQLINDYPRSIGSNNWAVAASKTQDGFAILCNDPHLSLTLPSIWYEVQLKTADFNAYGVSLPGIPYLAIGFNDHIAWGETNVGMDVSDLYEIFWEDSVKGTYLIDGQTMRVSTDIEEYKINGQKSVYDTVRLSKWGPVFIEENRSVALKWLPNLATDNCIVGSFRQLNKSNNFDDYYEALRLFKSPAQNFVFASQQADIALKVQGALPIKPGGEGQFILNGNNSDNDWKGYIPFDQTPFVKNPERGFVSSANQNSTDTTYPYKYHGYFDDYRGRTLNETLAKMSEITVPQMQELQNSTYSKLAADLTPLLLRLAVDQYQNNRWIEKLSSWDFYYKKDGSEPIIFEIWKDKLYNLIWDEFSAYEKDKNVEVLYPEMWRTISLIEEDPNNGYFDKIETPEIEDATALVLESFEYASEKCDSLFQDNPDLVWKEYRQVKINHLSRVEAFSEIGIDVGGVASALNSIKPTHGPSWRMVVQLSDPVEAWGVYPGGQSGNPGSPFYKNMISDWAAGKYYRLYHPGEPSQLESETHSVVKIVP